MNSEFRSNMVYNFNKKKLQDIIDKSNNKDELINASSKKNQIPILVFVTNKVKKVQFLLKNKANINIIFEYDNKIYTPLIWETIFFYDRQTIYMLLKYGADIYLTDGNNKTAIHYSRKKKKIYKLLNSKHEENKKVIFDKLYKKYKKKNYKKNCNVDIFSCICDDELLEFFHTKLNADCIYYIFINYIIYI